MESISQLVSDSLARHGMEPSLDHLRIEWSRWFRCESSFSVLLVPAKPGIFALGEEMVPAGSTVLVDGNCRAEGIKHAQAENTLLEATALSRVEGGYPVNPAPEGRPSLAQRFSAGEAGETISVPEGRPKPAGKRMLALFQISEADDLGMALGRMFLPGNPLLRKLNSGRCFARYAVIEDAAQRSAAYSVFQRWMQESAETASGINSCGAGALARGGVSGNPAVVQERFDSQPSNSSAWGVGFMEVQNREAKETVRRPTPLPSGF